MSNGTTHVMSNQEPSQTPIRRPEKPARSSLSGIPNSSSRGLRSLLVFAVSFQVHSRFRPWECNVSATTNNLVQKHQKTDKETGSLWDWSSRTLPHKMVTSYGHTLVLSGQQVVQQSYLNCAFSALLDQCCCWHVTFPIGSWSVVVVVVA